MPRRKIVQRMLALGATALTLGMRSRSDATPKPSANAALRWGVDYGAATDPALARTCALLVLEPHHARPIAPFRGPGSILLGYVSFGEVERSRPYFAALEQAGALKAVSMKLSDSRLAIASAGLEGALAAGGATRASLTASVKAVLALANPESLARAG